MEENRGQVWFGEKFGEKCINEVMWFAVRWKGEVRVVGGEVER